jgi:hypothetical protein
VRRDRREHQGTGQLSRGSDHREDDERADRDLDPSDPPDADEELTGFGGRGGVATGRLGPEREHPLRPRDDGRADEDVEAERHEDAEAEDDAPALPQRILQLLGSARREQVEHAGHERELRHPEGCRRSVAAPAVRRPAPAQPGEPP